MPNLVSVLPPVSRYSAKSQTGISDSRISDQSLTKESNNNSRTSDDIDIKIGPVTKLDKRNKTTSNIFDYDVISTNCDVIVIFSIYFFNLWKYFLKLHM